MTISVLSQCDRGGGEVSSQRIQHQAGSLCIPATTTQEVTTLGVEDPLIIIWEVRKLTDLLGVSIEHFHSYSGSPVIRIIATSNYDA